jgi:signal transduction histidine kinase
MTPLNLRELILFIAGFSLLFGLLMLFFKKSTPFIRGIFHWATGSFIVASSLFIYAFYPYPGEFINLLFTNLLAFTGQCFFLLAFWKFKEKRVNYLILIGLPVVSVIATTIFTYVYHHMGLRVTVNSVIYAIWAGFCFYEMLVPPDESLKIIFRVNAMAFLLFGLAMLTRAVVTFSLKEIDLMAPTIESLILFSALALAEILINFGFIIMVNVSIASDLTRQIAMKDRFFSIIAHDLKNPMNNILGFSELLLMKIKRNDIGEMEMISHAIKNSVIQTYNLLENLLEWSLSQSKKIPFAPEKIDLRQLIEEEKDFYLSFVASKKLTIEFIGEKDIKIFADRNMLKTILRNLITNAVKYSHTGGKIMIESKLLPSFVEIAITDTGVGIAPNRLEKIFTLDEKITTRGTAEEKGSGLGLLLCKEFIEKHKGKIWINSEPQKGTTVFFTLPLG